VNCGHIGWGYELAKDRIFVSDVFRDADTGLRQKNDTCIE
jgi:hypothetical protein